jgi:hypothetical protein
MKAYAVPTVEAPPDAVEHLSLIHVVRLEEIDADRRQTAGQN